MEFVLAVGSDPDVKAVFGAFLVMFGLLVLLIVLALKILICCKIFSKAGYCWAWGLLLLVPVANVIMAFVLAFGDWPVLKELRVLKQPRQ
jgi:hypothetical protein